MSALWGLPISGTPVGGVSDSEIFAANIKRLLGADPHSLIEDREKSKFYLRIRELRGHFSPGLTTDSTDEQIQR